MNIFGFAIIVILLMQIYFQIFTLLEFGPESNLDEVRVFHPLYSTVFYKIIFPLPSLVRLLLPS